MQRLDNIFKRDGSVADRLAQTIMGRILDGTFRPGVRLPTERELVAELGASRVTVREALRRLADWRVINTRQGSGATVLPRRFWTTGVVTSVCQHALTTGDWVGVRTLVSDVSSLRRGLLLEMVGRTAGRVQPGDLDPARRALRETWALRADIVAFAARDCEMISIMLEIAGLHASMFTLNALSETYLGLVQLAAAYTTFEVPETYVEVHEQVFAEQEAGDGGAARAHMSQYLETLDLALEASFPEDLSGLLTAVA